MYSFLYNSINIFVSSFVCNIENIFSDVFVYNGKVEVVIDNVKYDLKDALNSKKINTKDILEKATSHAGVPTHKTSNHSSAPYIDKRLREEK